MNIVLTGTDGSVWDLINGPVGLTTGGIKGFLEAVPPDDNVRNYSGRDGQVLTGWRIPEREVWLPLRFRGNAATDVEGLQRAWWRALAVGKYATIRVTDRAGAWREIAVRYRSESGRAMRIDPAVKSDPFAVTLVADGSWWLGPVVEFPFSAEQAGVATFFGNGSGATPFYIAPGQGSAQRSLINPGDEPAWIEWTLTAPAQSFSFSVAGRTVAGAIALAGSDTLVIDTSPQKQVARLNGAKVTRQLSAVNWAPIRSGESANVSISIQGTGLAVARFRPKYARAI